jgi:hypothetical protein
VKLALQKKKPFYSSDSDREFESGGVENEDLNFKTFYINNNINNIIVSPEKPIPPETYEIKNFRILQMPYHFQFPC